MAKILVVEDDVKLSEVVAEWLVKESHTVDVVGDGKEAFDRLKFYAYDLAVIDWDLPLMSGLEVCAAVRSSGGTLPILMLTGKAAINDKVTGFQSGADDYLVKPFHPLELSVRIGALLKRPAQRLQDVLVVGNLELDTTSHVVRKDGCALHLMPREFALLEMFMRHPEQPFSPEAILNNVWSSESEVSTDTVKVHIAKLRRKIDDQSGVSKITTVHGLGYKLHS